MFKRFYKTHYNINTLDIMNKLRFFLVALAAFVSLNMQAAEWLTSSLTYGGRCK